MDELRARRRRRRPGAGPARRRRALPGGRRAAGRGRRAHRPTTSCDLLLHARHPAPARLRPRRARGGARDVRPAGASCSPPGSGPTCASADVTATTSGCSSLAVLLVVVRRAARRRRGRALARLARRAPTSCVRRGPPRRRARCAGRSPTRRATSTLLLLLRVACELAATVLVTVVVRRPLRHDAGRRCSSPPASMVVVSYVAVGVAPRTLGRQHADARRAASARRSCTRWPRCSARCPSC